MALEAGQPAPLFQAKDMSGDEIALADYKGKCILLSFFRYAS